MALDLSSDNDNDSSNDEEDTDEYPSTYSTNSSIATNIFNDIETCVCDENGNRRSARIVYKMIQSTATCDKSTSNSDKQDEEHFQGKFSDDYISSYYSSSNPGGETKIGEAEIYSDESYDSDLMMDDLDMSMTTRIANYHKSSNDFNAKANKMNKKMNS
jgi:hypothetical protein